MKKVSVIIPCYNQGKYLAEAINSVLAQTYMNVEIIVTDDCSTDNTMEVLTDLAENSPNIFFIHNEKNLGVAASRNLAIEQSTGDYILPLDADDTIEKTYVEKAAKILDKNPNIGIVYCNARKFGKVNEKWDLPDFDISTFLFQNCIFNCAMFRKNDFIQAGGFDPDFNIGAEDWDLWLYFLETGLGVYKINETLFNYRIYDKSSRTQISSVNYKIIWQKILKKHIDLYVNNKDFIDKMFFFRKEDFIDKKRNKKILKYKKLFRIALIFSLFELLCILFLGGLLCFR